MLPDLQTHTQTKTISGRTWHFSHAIGNITVRGRGFFWPTAVTITNGGIVYVLNSRHEYQGYSDPISKLTLDEDYLGEFGGQDFTWPQGLASDKDGNVYCSDAFDHFGKISQNSIKKKRFSQCLRAFGRARGLGWPPRAPLAGSEAYI